MAGLDQFLTQIGAAELSSVVTVPTTNDGLGPMGQLLARVQQEIEAVNDQTRALLLAEWPEFTKQVQNGQALLSEISQEEKDLVELEGLMEGKDAILPPLVTALKSRAELSTAHANSSAELALYNSLLSFHQHISTLSSLTSTGALPHAVSALASLLAYQRNDAPEPWIASTPAFRALERWAADERARLEAALVTAVEACFEVEAGKEDRQAEEPHATLRLRSAVAAAPGARELGVTELLEALEGAYQLPATDSTLTKNRTVEYHLSRVAKQLIKHFVAPFLSAAGSAATGAAPVSFGYATAPDSPHEQIALLVPEPPHQPPLATLSSFLSFVGSHSSLIPSPWAAAFTKHFTPALQQLVVDSLLAPSLPKAIADLPPYLALLVAASGFEGEFLPNGGWFSFLPPPPSGAPPREEATVVKSWMARVDRHWAKRVGDLALSSVREVVQTNDWQGEEVETEVVEVISAPPPPPPAPKEPTPPPPAPPVIAAPPPQPRTTSPAVKGRNFSPAGGASPTLAPSPIVTPAPRPGKLGTRIGSPATTIPIKPASSGTSIPIKPKSGSVPIPVRVRTNTSSPSQSHFPRESVAKVAENGLVAAGIAKVIENARAASPSPPQGSPVEPASKTSQTSQGPPPPIVAPTPVAAAPAPRRVSITSPPPPSSSPGVSRSPSIGKKRRGSIVSHAPVTHVEPSADEPDWNLSLSPVIDPVAELGWGSGPGFFDMLNNNGPLEPVVEQDAASEAVKAEAPPAALEPEIRSAPAAEQEVDLEGGGDEDGWDLGVDEAELAIPGEDEPVASQKEPAAPKPASPPPAAAPTLDSTPAVLEPAFDYAPPPAEPNEPTEPVELSQPEPEPEPELLLDNGAIAQAPELELEGLPAPTTSATEPEQSARGSELISAISPEAVTALLPEVNVSAAATAVTRAPAAVGAGAIETASHLFGASDGQEDDIEAGETGDDDGWGIEGGDEAVDDNDTSWRYEPPPPMAKTPEPPVEAEDEEASGWQYSPPKPLAPESHEEEEHDEESGWGYEPVKADERDPEAGHQADEESWGYEPEPPREVEAVETDGVPAAVPALELVAEAVREHGQDTFDYTPLETDAAAREHTFEPTQEDDYDPEAGRPAEEAEDDDPWALEEAGQAELEPAASVEEPVEDPVESVLTPASAQVKRTISSVETAELQPAYKPFSVEPTEELPEAGDPSAPAADEAEAEVEAAPADEQLPQPVVANEPVAPEHAKEPLTVEPEAEVEPTGWGLPRSDAIAEHDLLSAHDYLPPVEAATPLATETPEEFIVPGEGLPAVPTMLVPELFEGEPKRASYEHYQAEPSAEEEHVDDGWDLEIVAGEPAPEPFGEPAVEEEAGAVEHEQVPVQPTAGFDVVVDSTPAEDDDTTPSLPQAEFQSQPEPSVEAQQPAIEEADQVDLATEARKHSPAPIDVTAPMVTISVQPPSPASTTGADIPVEFQPELEPTPEVAETAEDDFTWDEEEEARLIREVEEAERELAEAQAEAQAKAEQRAERRASMLMSPGVEDIAEVNEEEQEEWDAEEEARLMREVEEAERALEEAEAELARAYDRGGTPSTPAPERAGFQPAAFGAEPEQAQPSMEEVMVAPVEHVENPESERELAPEVEEAEHVPALDAPVGEAEEHQSKPEVEIAVEPLVTEPELTDRALAAAAPTEVEVQSAEQSEEEAEHGWDLDENEQPSEEEGTSVEPAAEPVPFYHAPAQGEERRVEPEVEAEAAPAPVPEAEVPPFEAQQAAPAAESLAEEGDGWDLDQHDDFPPEQVPLQQSPIQRPPSPVAAVLEALPATPAAVVDQPVAPFDEPDDTHAAEDDGWGLEEDAHEPAVAEFVEEVDFPAVQTERELGIAEPDPSEVAPAVDELLPPSEAQAEAEPELAAEDEGWGLEHDDEPVEEASESVAIAPAPIAVEEQHELASHTTVVHEPLFTSTYEPQVHLGAEPEPKAEDHGWDLDQDEAEPEEAEAATLDQVPVIQDEVKAELAPAPEAVTKAAPVEPAPVVEAQLEPEVEGEVEDDGWGIEAEEDAEPVQPEADLLESHQAEAADALVETRPAQHEPVSGAPEPEVEYDVPEDDGWGLGDDDGADEAHHDEDQPMSSPEVINKSDTSSPPAAQTSFTPKPHWASASAGLPTVHSAIQHEEPAPSPPVTSYAAAAATGVEHASPLAMKTQPAAAPSTEAEILGTSAGTDDGDGWGFSPGTSPAYYGEYIAPAPVAPPVVPAAAPVRTPAPPPPALAPVRAAVPPSASKALPPRASASAAPAPAPAPAAQGDDGWGFEDGLELDLDLGEAQEDVYEDMDAPVTPQIFTPPVREKMTTHPRAPPSLTSSISNQSYISNTSAGSYGFNQSHVRTATPPNRNNVLSPAYSHRSYGSNASASYTFSPPSSSKALSPPPPESEEEVEEAEDAWGFEDDSLEVGDEEPEALRLRGGASTPEPSVDEGAWELKRNSLPLKEGQKLRRRKETMMISSSSRQLIKVAEEVLTQALAVGEAGFPYPTFAAASSPLFQTFISLFALYRATAPVQHAQLLETVPALGMQFANDALWLADELDRVWDRLGGQYRPDLQHQTEAVNDTVKKMKRMGKEHRAKQIEIQRRALMELLDEAKGFLYTADQARFEGCERALQQVVHSLNRLVAVWKPVLNPAVLWSTIGDLINDVLVRVLDEIEGQSDISEEESGKLNKLCKMLHDLDQLFEGTNTSIGREVPTYFKFVFLSELLEASMADVLFLFDNGHLVDFALAEIAKLVRALFADSPLRAKNLEHIMKGHPEALGAIGEEEEEGWGV